MDTGEYLRGRKSLSLYPSEPHLRRLLTTWGPVRVFVGASLLFWVAPLIGTLIDGTLTIKDGRLSPRMQYMLVLPFLFATIARYYEEASVLLDKLACRGILTLEDAPGPETNDEESAEFLDRSVASLANEVAKDRLSGFSAALPYVIGSLVPIFFLLNGASPDHRPIWLEKIALLNDQVHSADWLFTGDAIRPIGYYYTFAFFGLGFAVLVAWALSHLRGARILSHIFEGRYRLRFELRILHPDGCMGLGPVSELVKESGIVLLLLSLTVFLWTAGFRTGHVSGYEVLKDTGVVIAWIAYLISSPVLFFAPLMTARRRMWLLKRCWRR